MEILNLAVSGYNPYNQGELLRDLGLAYEPDLVLAQFCINDLNDPTLHFDTQTRLRLGSIPDPPFPDPPLRRSRSAEPGATSRRRPVATPQPSPQQARQIPGRAPPPSRQSTSPSGPTSTPRATAWRCSSSSSA